MSRYELVAVDLEAPDDDNEELLATGSHRQMIREMDETLADAGQDYEDGRYPWRTLRVQPA